MLPYHFRARGLEDPSARDELFLSAASVGTCARAGAFREAIEDVAQQASPTLDHRVVFWPAAADPCLQVTDYCTWAIQRKWERGDGRSYDLIKDKIASEYELWRIGNDAVPLGA